MIQRASNFFSLEIYDHLSEILPVGIIIYDSDAGQCLFANKTAQNIIGASEEQLLKQNFREIPSWKVSGLLETAEKAIQTGKTLRIEANFMSSFKKMVWMNASMMPFKNNGQNYLILVFDDVTQIKSQEAKNKNQSFFLQALLEAIPNPIFYKDIKGVYQGCNDAFTKFLGKTREEIIGHTAFDIAPKDLAQIYHEADKKLFKDNVNQTYEAEVEGKDGQRKNAIFNKAIYRDANNQPNGLVGVILDITERKKIEAELKKNNEELKRINELMIGRELKMVELKKEIEELKKKIK